MPAVTRLAAMLLALCADADVDRQVPGQVGTHRSGDADKPMRVPKNVRDALPARGAAPVGDSGFGS